MAGDGTNTPNGEPVLDVTTLTALEGRLGRDRVVRVVAAQLSNGRDVARRLSAFEIAPDAAAVKALAHQLAGSSGSIGLLRLSGEAASAERAAGTAVLPELAAVVRGLRLCLEASLEALCRRYPEAADR
jgi:HPt (histidine-containing phosphotransfer) domain-containing protein